MPYLIPPPPVHPAYCGPRMVGGQKLWTCVICDREDAWGPTWSWWGNADEVGAVVCSRDCLVKLNETWPPAVATELRRRAAELERMQKAESRRGARRR